MQDKNNNGNQTNNNNPEEMQQETLENNGSNPQQNHSISETAGRIGGEIAGRRIAENLKARRHSDTPNSKITNGLNEQTNTGTPSPTHQQSSQSTSQNSAGNQSPIAANEGTTNAKTPQQQIKNPDAPKNGGAVPNQAGKSTKTGENPAKPKASRTQNNNRKTSNLNPSRRFNPKNIASKHSKHSGNNDIPPLSENENGGNHLDKIKNKTAPQKNIQKSATKKSAKKMASAAPKVASTAAKSASKLVAGIASFIMSSPVVIITGLVICLAVLFASLIAPFIASLQPYGEDEDGNVCFATAPCTNIVLKNGDTEKKYKLDEYIAGAMVDYYDYSSVVKYTLGKPSINDNLLKALAVIIHTDISIYSSYDSQTSTCTIDDTSKFKNVYEPTVTDDNSDTTDITDETENQETNQDSTEEQDSQNNVDTENDSSTNSENKQTKEDKYYYQAKSAVNSVLSEVVDAYSTNLELKYSGYLQVLHNAADAGQDYQKIVKTYIKNDPNYVSKTSATEDDEDQDNSAEDNSIGIYPICYFDKSSTGTGPISYSSDICSTVHINNGTNAGDYTIDEFIEGVVYNEARAWTDSLDTLKAHAVAARTYLVNRGKVENGTCYMTVGGNTMGFTKSTNTAIHQAVTETSGEYIMVNGQISKQAEWDALCITNPDTTGSTYTICQKNQQIPKEWFSKVKLFGTISWYNKHSHGRGMSQYGAYYLATVQGKSYKDIINYYYGADIGTVITQSKEGFVMPINTFNKITGETTGYCGSGKPHTGIDFAAPTGTPIYAAHDGVIVKTYDNGTNCYGSCNSTQAVGIGFRIDNQDGTISMYMHMSKRENLSRGTSVKAGQLLGYVGNTGSSTGPHLHYGMSNSTNGAVLNPRSYLPLDEKGFGKCYNYR